MGGSLGAQDRPRRPLVQERLKRQGFATLHRFTNDGRCAGNDARNTDGVLAALVVKV